MTRTRSWLLLLGTLLLLFGSKGFAGDAPADQKGPPPALVQVAHVTNGAMEPMVELVGTVYYTRVAKVAAEVEGPVAAVEFEEGQRVTAGAILVRLQSDILDTRLAETRATLGQARVELQGAAKDLDRMETLYRDNSIAESVYDQHLYKKKGLEHKAAALQAALARLELEKKKKNITAPFSGIVIDKMTEQGEWIDSGDPVTVVADDRTVDVIIDVPQEMLALLTPGRKLTITSNGQKLVGCFIGYVPKGDIATRTFAVKLRLDNTASLVEGMEARAELPAGRKITGLLVPRDALLNQFGRNVIWLVRNNSAQMVPVTVTGYNGKLAGISGNGLAVDELVVIKGHERLRNGQPVRVIGAN